MTAAAYDFVIVGAGSAGCVLACRLTEDRDTRVLLLEAGGPDRSPWLRMPAAFWIVMNKKDVNWNYMSEPEPALGGRRLEVPRGRVLGGSSSINGMLYVRGHPRDYDQWRQMGNEGWGYADVLPYFRKAESNWRGDSAWHGDSGPLKVTPVDRPEFKFAPLEAAAIAAGLPITGDHAGAAPEGLGKPDQTVGDGRRASAAQTYLKEARGRPNLTVTTGALSERVLIERGRAVGVRYRQDGQVREARAEREVILSGGSYNSPQLLLLSGVGPADELRAVGIDPVHDLPGVGRNLSEHPFNFVTFSLVREEAFLEQLRFDRALLSVANWALFGRGLLATNVCAALAFLRTRPELERPDVELICSAARLDAKIWFPVVRPMQEPRVDIGISLLHPDSRGVVSLRSADPTDHPRILFNMFKERSDVETMMRGVRLCRELYNTEPQRSQVTGEPFPGPNVASDEQLETYIRATCGVTHHPVGTCSMGGGREAVVDAQLRVHGLTGLRVIDASVMPTVPGGNTNAPTIMVAEKAADLIRGKSLPPAEV